MTSTTAQIRKKWHRRISKKCPFPDCTYHYMTENGLFGHLFTGHLKSELAKLIIDDLLLFERIHSEGTT